MKLLITFFFLNLITSTTIAQCTKEDIVRLKKSAFIVGENQYIDNQLENAVNDAVDISNALNRLGFNSKLDTNVSYNNLKYDIECWTRNLKKIDIAIFYFAGHGAEFDGENYIYPIDANVAERNKQLIKQSTYSASTLIKRMTDYNQHINIIILDACRNDPTRGSIKSPTSNGLASISEIQTGVLIAFPVGPGKETPDGEGKRNSIYAHAILGNIEVPNTPISKIFGKIHDDVVEISKNEQSPYFNTSLGYQNDFCLSIREPDYEDKSVQKRDTSFSTQIKRFRSIIPDTSYKSQYRIDSELFEIAEHIITNNIRIVWDSIKGTCECYPPQTPSGSSPWDHRFIMQPEIMRKTGDRSISATISIITKSNEAIFKITSGSQLQKLESKNGLPSDTTITQSVYNFDWNKIGAIIRAYFFNRLEILE